MIVKKLIDSTDGTSAHWSPERDFLDVIPLNDTSGSLLITPTWVTSLLKIGTDPDNGPQFFVCLPPTVTSVFYIMTTMMVRINFISLLDIKVLYKDKKTY